MTYLPKAARREALLQAALSVLRREGLSRVTTRAVATEAGAAAGIVHHHFASGDALRGEAFRRFLEADLARLDAALADAPDDRLPGLLVAELVPGDLDDVHWRLWCEAWDVSRTDPAIAAVYAEAIAAWHGRLAEAVRRLSSRGDRARRPAPGWDPADAAWRLLALADGLAGFALSQPQALTLERARRLVAEALDRELMSAGERPAA